MKLSLDESDSWASNYWRACLMDTHPDIALSADEAQDIPLYSFLRSQDFRFAGHSL
jgi:hypothetical protein